MKKTTFRLLGLFLVMFTMNQQAFALDWLQDFFNNFTNPDEKGYLFYSKVTAQSIG